MNNEIKFNTNRTYNLHSITSVTNMSQKEVINGSPRRDQGVAKE
jgi:hypothetical protein